MTGEATQVQLSKEGLAELTRTLPIHKYGQDQLVREGANVRAHPAPFGGVAWAGVVAPYERTGACPVPTTPCGC